MHFILQVVETKVYLRSSFKQIQYDIYEWKLSGCEICRNYFTFFGDRVSKLSIREPKKSNRLTSTLIRVTPLLKCFCNLAQ